MVQDREDEGSNLLNGSEGRKQRMDSKDALMVESTQLGDQY